MLQEAIDLQQNAVTSLFRELSGRKREITFRSPTGSGKTHMMADLMNRVLSEHDDIIFLVSTLSKGGLAQQNYDSFEQNSSVGLFPKIKPYLINTELAGEEGLFIPTDYNVYVLPRDLYRDGGRLMQGAMQHFLDNMTNDLFGQGKNKRIYLIKDECHQATNNLDNLKEDYFHRVLNFSATPNLGRGQVPDVQITDDEAVRAKLIKDVLFGNDDDSIEDALDKFREIKEDYINKLGVSPCLIIQISNKEKAEEELENRIMPALNKLDNQSLKWMIIANPTKKGNKTIDLSDTNDSIKGKLPKEKWKDYAKKSAIDVIVFKMVISEGWDIPRACMLYQVRDTTSKQLDEQVMGRVRRNPRLLDFENLDKEAQELAMTAWVWGIPPEGMRKTYNVQLNNEAGFVQHSLKVKTTKLVNITERRDFDVKEYLESQPSLLKRSSIFELYAKYRKCPNDLQSLCDEFAGDNVCKWLLFMEHIDGIKKRYNDYICNYDKSMTFDKETSFPLKSSYLDSEQHDSIDDWVWCKKNSDTEFAFDSESERLWATQLGKLKNCASIEKDEAEIYLWGKNFPKNSEIKYEYYANGIHSSYPDFVLKDTKDNIHLFEVKSLDKSNNQNINEEEYKDKVRALKECYKACSKILAKHIFYLPIRSDGNWDITRFIDGKEEQLTLSMFKESFKKLD